MQWRTPRPERINPTSRVTQLVIETADWTLAS